MGELEELLDRMTIEFPMSISVDEIENGLFMFLAKEGFMVRYSLQINGNKGYDFFGERYSEKFTGNIEPNPRSSKGGFNSHFEMIQTDSETYNSLYNAMKFQGVPGYDSLREFESLPSGKQQLETISGVRETVDSYFSQRPK